MVKKFYMNTPVFLILKSSAGYVDINDIKSFEIICRALKDTYENFYFYSFL